MRAVGADAYAGGWVAVSLVDGAVDRVWAGPTIDVVLADQEPSTVVGIDLPLGGTADQWRQADREAKRLLGVQHSRVFLVPPRPVWDIPVFADAAALCQRLTGHKPSIQTFRLLPKMLEVERYRDTGPHSLYEIHPELVFVGLNDGPLAYGKKTWDGQQRRRALLAGVGVVLADALAEAGSVPPNDILDAAAVAWCASRIAGGQRRHLPAHPEQVDHRGRPILIWY